MEDYPKKLNNRQVFLTNIETIKRLNKFSALFKRKTWMNFAEFFVYCLVIKEFNKLYLIDLGKVTKYKILNNLFSIEDSLIVVIYNNQP